MRKKIKPKPTLKQVFKVEPRELEAWDITKTEPTEWNTLAKGRNMDI
jgi:hypothetical protein